MGNITEVQDFTDGCVVVTGQTMYFLNSLALLIKVENQVIVNVGAAIATARSIITILERTKGFYPIDFSFRENAFVDFLKGLNREILRSVLADCGIEWTSLAGFSVGFIDVFIEAGLNGFQRLTNVNLSVDLVGNLIDVWHN